MLEKNYFCDIDVMPLYNWRKCQEKGDLTFTRRNKKEGDPQNDLEAWSQTYKSFLNHFGISDKHRQILEIEKRIGILNCDLVITGDRFLKNEIKRLERELKELTDTDSESIGLGEAISHVSKWQSFRVNAREITVLDFFESLHTMNKEYSSNGREKDK